MGVVLQFRPKGEPVPETAPLSPAEMELKLKKHTIDCMRELVKYYQSTGHWTPACETHTIQAIQELTLVCAILAGESNGTTTPTVG